MEWTVRHDTCVALLGAFGPKDFCLRKHVEHLDWAEKTHEPPPRPRPPPSFFFDFALAGLRSATTRA